MQAVLAGRRRLAPKPAERRIPELQIGGELYDMAVVAVAHANKDNYFSARTLMQAPARMMPCTDPDCTHPVRRVELPGENDAKLAQKLGQPQPFVAAFLPEFMGQLASFGPA